jgi:hypothetical protein
MKALSRPLTCISPIECVVAAMACPSTPSQRRFWQASVLQAASSHLLCDCCNVHTLTGAQTRFDFDRFYSQRERTEHRSGGRASHSERERTRV